MKPGASIFASVLCAASIFAQDSTPAQPKTGQQAPPAAQKEDAAKEPELKIKAYTKLVQVPVIVTDKYGRHATGLTKDDFVILENGSEKKVSTFELITTNHAPVHFRKLAPGLYSNLLAGDAGQRAISMIVMDAINTPMMDQAYARRQVIKYLAEKVEPGTLLSLVIISRRGMKVIHDYTTDPAVLIEALKRAKGEGSSPTADQVSARAADPSDNGGSDVDSEANALVNFMESGDSAYESFQRGVAVLDTVSALREIAHSLAGIPGRKSLVWATASFPFLFNDPKGFSSSDFSPQIAKMFQELNDANVAVYPVDVRGLINYSFPAASSTMSTADVRNPTARMQRNFSSFRNSIDTLNNMAEMTGGVAYYNTNDLSGSFRKAAEDSSSYYMLGYYLTGGENAKPEWRKIKVQVKKPGYHVRNRSGLFVVPQAMDPVKAKRADLNAAIRSPMDFTTLALVVKWQPELSKPDAPSPFFIEVDTSDLAIQEPENEMSLELVVQALTPEKQVIDEISQTIEGKIKDVAQFRKKPLQYTNKIKPFSGPATVRFIVRDNISGKMGSVIVYSPGSTANQTPKK